MNKRHADVSIHETRGEGQTWPLSRLRCLGCGKAGEVAIVGHWPEKCLSDWIVSYACPCGCRWSLRWRKEPRLLGQIAEILP
jgi:hypothetical protein